MQVYLSRAKEVADANNVPYEVGEAYVRYLDRVNQQNRNDGRPSTKDTHRQKVYDAEHKHRRVFPRKQITIEEARAITEKVFSSRVWEKYKTKRAAQMIPVIEHRPSLRCWSGLAEWQKIILGAAGLNLSTLLHELAHTNGHRHHQQSFRAAHVAFVKRFESRESGEHLENCYKEAGLKARVYKPKKAKTFEKWYPTYERMASARDAADKYS